MVWAHSTALCGSLAEICREKATTVLSRDGPCGNVPNHAAARYGSVCPHRLIKLSAARWRTGPSAKDITQLAAASGSLPAHCQVIVLAAVACASFDDKRPTQSTALLGFDSATTLMMLGKTMSRLVVDKLSTHESAACGSTRA